MGNIKLADIMEIDPDIEFTGDGSQTLRHTILGEAYHSLNGAEAESQHVFIRNGFDACQLRHLRILEAGFGSGLNALLTFHAAERSGRTVEYTAVELYPVSMKTVCRMSFAGDDIFVKLHTVAWGVPQMITNNFTLHKIERDLADMQFEATFDIVYFDAFAPDSQPELWTAEVFGKIFRALEPGGILVTYSAKGDVKRTLREVGFRVERLQGAPGKRHMLRAVKS